MLRTAPKTAAVPVACFEISNNPSAKTDYELTVCGSTRHQEEVKAWLWQIHTALASHALPEDEALVGYTLSFGAQDEQLFCLCRAKCIIPEDRGRPYLYFQTVFASLRHLMEANVNPLSLHYSDVWQMIEQERFANGAVPCSLATGSAPLDSSADAVTLRLAGGPQAPAEISVISFEAGVSRVHRAFEQIGWRQISQSSFAIGIPRECQLPKQPMLIVRVAAPPQSIPTIASPIQNPYQSPGMHAGTAGTGSLAASTSAYRNYLARVADDVGCDTKVPPLWTARIWNRCQDSLGLLDSMEQAGTLRRYRERRLLFATHHSLLLDLERAGVAGERQMADQLREQWSNMKRARSSRPRWQIASLLAVAVAIVGWVWLAKFAPRVPSKGGDAARPTPTTVPSKPAKPTRAGSS